jgi:Cu2+-containing amine oxidase
VVAAFDAANSGATSIDFFTPDHRQGGPSVQKSMEALEPDRRVRFRLVVGPELSALEALVSLTTREVVSVEKVEGVCPTILLEESWLAGEAVKADPRWQAAMGARGITDFDHVTVDPWPAGRFGLPEEEGRRLARAISYVRERPDDNQHARPIEGVVALVDLGRATTCGRSKLASPRARASRSTATSCAGSAGRCA